MIKEVQLPEISEDVTSGDVVKVLVSVGDSIAVDQPVVELETDKAVFEVPSSATGIVTEVLVNAGDTIRVGQTIVMVDTSRSAGANQPAAPRVEKVPTEVSEETTKAATEPAHSADPQAPAFSAASAGPKASQSPRETIEDEPVPTGHGDARPVPGTSATPTTAEAAPASPSLRRLARELGVDIRKVTGSGPGGRIVREDLTRFARDAVSGARETAAAASVSEANTESTKWGPVVREPMTKVRQITARSMSNAWATIPHVTQYDKVDITELEDVRKQYTKRLEASGGKLTMTAILAKAGAAALKVFPKFNASVDIESHEVIYKRYYNIGIAVDTDRGLIVPVIRGVDKKNISELAIEINRIAERTREKKITPEELEGGTFTISNLGGIGGTNFSPIVYAPQVAILGVARASIEPVWVKDRFEPRLMLPLSVSYDHRLIDGADAARFLRWIVKALEEPLLLALEG